MRLARIGEHSSAPGFTLIELLTVIAVIAVLSSLLLTGVMAAKKKARILVCTSNLHQFSLALDLYLDDSDGKRPSVERLVDGKYLASPRSLICPEDKTGDWGRLVESGGMLPVGSATNSPVRYSYLLEPLHWSDAEWKLLLNCGSRAGVAACQLHGLGNQKTPDLHNYSGLLLRAQLDGSVSRRQFFWNPVFGAVGSVIPTANLGTEPPNSLQIFFDDPTNWQNYL